MVTTRPPKTIVKPTALGPVASTDTKLLICGHFKRAELWHRTGYATSFLRITRMTFTPSCAKARPF